MAAGMNAMSDEDVVLALQSGEAGAFDVLVKRHTERFYAAAYRICGQADEAEDVLQEAFLKLWRRPESYDADRGAKFTTWFYRVVVNAAKDKMRSRRKEFGSDIVYFVEDTADNQQEAMQARQEEERIERGIQGLPERQRLALNLCFYEGLSNKEAAGIMGVGVKALESLLMRAKAKLREELLSDDREHRNGHKERSYG